MAELTADGFVNPKMCSKTFIQNDEKFSPVIRFRWGYKASSEELQQFGHGIYLNEYDYWGGGPFANGCTTLPDLWGSGIEEDLFLFLHVQHLNPTHDRNVYSCPPRPYFVLAAHRLARLVESIRRQQADVPITIVCHSQGNMIGMAAAFLGDRMEEVTDVAGHRGRCVADSYVLCNPPYSLVGKDVADNWAQRHMEDPQGRRGRQTLRARTETLAAFFDIVRQRAPLQQDATRIDQRMANVAHGFTAESDRSAHGIDGSTCGRVTLYCNPHDQVISATTVQGIGWRGLSADEIAATRGEGTFTQRVFAQGFEVGHHNSYDYWAHHYKSPKPGSLDFWKPHSPCISYSLSKGLEANRSFVGKIFTAAVAPVLFIVLKAFKTRINALPPDSWVIPLQAPPLKVPFKPQAIHLGVASEQFDQTFDPPGAYRNAQAAARDDDPYAGIHRSEDGTRDDSPRGTEQSEASLRYEGHALMRMQAKRDGRYKNDAKVTEEDEPDKASADYTAWRNDNIKTYLAKNIDTHATDHSTIMTNPMHAECALAYDVAIGNCDIRQEDLYQLRIAADWRFVDGLNDKSDTQMLFEEYFNIGKFHGTSVYKWANIECRMPENIVDHRDGAPYLIFGYFT